MLERENEDLPLPDEFAHDSPTSYTPSTYSRDNFYVTSSDSKGHSKVVRLSTPPEVKGRIASLIARQIIPVYRTEQDFHRDALVHRLHDLSDMLTNDAPVFSGELEILSRLLRVEADMDKFLAVRAADQRLYDSAMQLLLDPGFPGAVEAAQRVCDVLDSPKLRKELQRKIDETLT